MRFKFVLAAVFACAFGIGMVANTPTAECRMCNAKKCFHESACGRQCTCLFDGGQKGKAGRCVQVGG